MQSVGSSQPSPSGHDGHTGPPQSSPVSVPSLVWFLHEAGGPSGLASPTATSLDESPPPPSVLDAAEGTTSSTGASSEQAGTKIETSMPAATASSARARSPRLTAHRRRPDRRPAQSPMARPSGVHASPSFLRAS